ncbi:hypothetical protein M0Q97_12890 [Candidatus Dojkabacteria bacterium]|jgi:hypothetical protein|nr:hypothetical protein [Candidatus Dojkabacteria bacterium]
MSYEIDEEVEEFINNPDLELTHINNESSQKTNFHIVEINFNLILTWFLLLRDYVKYLRTLIDIETISQLVIDNLLINKTMLSIFYDWNIDQIIIESGYQLKRIGLTTIEITKLNQITWNNSRLMVQVKNATGDIVYPVITTANNKILIEFQDGILTNYTVIMM